MENKIQRGIQLNLKEVRNGLENSLENLDYVSKQLALDDRTASRLQDYISSTKYDKISIKQEFDERLALIKNTNPNVGNMFYYLPDSEGIVLYTQSIFSEVDPFTFPLLAKRNGLGLYGPHVSMDGNPQHLVFSVLREVNKDQLRNQRAYVYIEVDFHHFQDLLHNDQYGLTVKHLLLDQDGKIVYSERPDGYPVGSFLPSGSDSFFNPKKGYYEFAKTSEQGWRIIATVSRSDLFGEMRLWLGRFITICVFSFLLSLYLFWRIWKLIVGNLNAFKREIEVVAGGQFTKTPRLLQILEFDDLIRKFNRMRERIVELLHEVEEKEKNKRILEVEKLKYQINPHFIHNTLNTIQWIARINKQEEIDRLIAIFTRLLHYNLGKEGEMVYLREEIEAIHDYVALQKIRYNFNFQVQIHVPEEAESLLIPRFLLQPVVENSLYHGFSDKDGMICVDVHSNDQGWVIEVSDTGKGMSEDAIQRLFAEEADRRKSGLGIGLSFVDQMIKNYYGESYGLAIRSEQGVGTTMSILIPSVEKEDKQP